MNKRNINPFLYIYCLFLKCYIVLNLVTPNLLDKSTDVISHKQILLLCNNEKRVDPIF